MKTTFSFGKNGIEVSVPDSYACRVVRSHTASAIGDGSAALAYALDHPIGCDPLVKMAAGKRSAAIAVCDITRPAPNEITLPRCWRACRSRYPSRGCHNFDRNRLHRGATQDEVETIVGAEIAANIALSVMMPATWLVIGPWATPGAAPRFSSTSASWPPTSTFLWALLSST